MSLLLQIRRVECIDRAKLRAGMAYIHVPESLPCESQPSNSQRYVDYGLEATQLSQPHFSQTQGTQGTAFVNSQVEPWRKYCEWRTKKYIAQPFLGAILIPTDADHSILKIPWTKLYLQVGRGPHGLSGNDIVLQEKRISNKHCKFTLGMQSGSFSGTTSQEMIQSWKEGEADPEVWVEDMGSSNGTFVSDPVTEVEH